MEPSGTQPPAQESPGQTPQPTPGVPRASDPAVDLSHSVDSEGAVSAAVEHLKSLPPEGTEPEPAPEPTPEPPPTAPPQSTPAEEPKAGGEPPQKSARERFIEAAEAERKRREGDDKLKRREADLETREQRAAQALARLEQLEADPIAFIERTQPGLFEQMVERYAQTGGQKPKDKTEPEWKAELTALRDEIKSLKDTTQDRVATFNARKTLDDAMRLISSDEYSAIREYAQIAEEFSGEPVDLEMAIAQEHDSFLSQYGKRLTPNEIVEIMRETAQEKLDRLPKSQRLKSLLGLQAEQQPGNGTPQPQSKPKPQVPGNTATSAQQTASMSARDIEQELEGLDGEDRIEKIVELARAGRLPT